MPIPLLQRTLEPEWMDQPDLDPALHANALRGLARLNRISRSAQILWPPICRLAREISAKELTILDLASGAGDVPIQLWRMGRHNRVGLQIVGCDVSRVAIEHASQLAHDACAAVEFRQHDVFAFDEHETFDIVMCSLFLHHQDPAHAVTLLRQMAQRARRLVLVNDLARSRLNYALTWLATRTLTRSPVVHVDGPRSVAAAFTLIEARQLAEAAGMHSARIEPRWPCRWLLSWRKPA